MYARLRRAVRGRPRLGYTWPPTIVGTTAGQRGHRDDVGGVHHHSLAEDGPLGPPRLESGLMAFGVQGRHPSSEKPALVAHCRAIRVAPLVPPQPHPITLRREPLCSASFGGTIGRHSGEPTRGRRRAIKPARPDGSTCVRTLSPLVATRVSPSSRSGPSSLIRGDGRRRILLKLSTPQPTAAPGHGPAGVGLPPTYITDHDFSAADGSGRPPGPGPGLLGSGLIRHRLRGRWARASLSLDREAAPLSRPSGRNSRPAATVWDLPHDP